MATWKVFDYFGVASTQAYKHSYSPWVWPTKSHFDNGEWFVLPSTHAQIHTYALSFVYNFGWVSVYCFVRIFQVSASAYCLNCQAVYLDAYVWKTTKRDNTLSSNTNRHTHTHTHTYTGKQSNRYLCTHSEAFEQLWLSLCLRVLNCLWVIANHEQFALTSSIVVAVPVVEVWLFISLTFTPTWTLGRWYVPLPCRQVPIYDFDFSLVLHFTNGLCFDFLRPYACVSFVLHLQRLLSKCICLPQCVSRLSKRVYALVCACICA